MSSPIASRIARQLGTDADATGRILEEIIEDIRGSVARDGQAIVPGLGVFRTFGGRMVFEPERTLALAVNQRYAGLEPLLVNAEPTSTAHNAAASDEPVAADLYPTEAPPFAVHPVDADGEGLDEDHQAVSEADGTSDRSGYHEGVYTDAVPAPSEPDRPFDEAEEESYPAADMEDTERIETSALEESSLDEVPAPDEPEFDTPFGRAPEYVTEEEAGAPGPLPELTVHEPEEQEEPEADLAAITALLAAEHDDLEEANSDETLVDASLAEELEEPASPSPSAPTSPFFEPWADGPEEVRPEPEPPVEPPGPEEELYSFLEPENAGVYPEPEAEHAPEASEQPLAEWEPEAVEEREEPAPAAETGFRPEPIDDDYTAYPPVAPPITEPVEPQPAESVHPAPEEPVVAAAAPPERKRPRAPVLIAAIILLGMLGVLAYALSRPDEPPAPAITEAPPPIAVPATPADTTSLTATPTDSMAVPDATAEDSEPIAAEPEPSSPLHPVGGIDLEKGGLTIVVASVLEREAAEEVAERYRRAGFDPAIIYGERGGVRRYRVGIGQFMDDAAAEAQRASLPEIFPEDAWLMAVERNMILVE